MIKLLVNPKQTNSAPTTSSLIQTTNSVLTDQSRPVIGPNNHNQPKKAQPVKEKKGNRINVALVNDNMNGSASNLNSIQPSNVATQQTTTRNGKKYNGSDIQEVKKQQSKKLWRK